MSKIHRYSFILIPLFFIFSCSENKSIDIEITLTSEVEKLVNHSKEFDLSEQYRRIVGGRMMSDNGFSHSNS